MTTRDTLLVAYDALPPWVPADPPPCLSFAAGCGVGGVCANDGATRGHWLGTATGAFVGDLVGTLIFGTVGLLSVLFAAAGLLVSRNGLSAEVLREFVAKEGGHQPRSHLATGNLTFSASPELLEVIRAGIEDSIESVLGRLEDVFIRSVASLASAVRSDPFAEMRADDVYERRVTSVPTDPPVSLSLPMQTPRSDAVLFAR